MADLLQIPNLPHDSVPDGAGGAIVARYLVIYKNATVNTIVKPLAGVFVLDTAPADYTLPDGTTGTFTPNASGIFTLTGATTD